MKNSDRVAHAFLGFGVGGFASLVVVPIFMFFAFDKPFLWFFFAMFGVAPAGAILGWIYAAEIMAWMKRNV